MNRPFLSFFKPLYQSEAKCEVIDMEMTSFLMQIKLICTRKIKKGFALSLGLKVRDFGTWKWPIYKDM